MDLKKLTLKFWFSSVLGWKFKSKGLPRNDWLHSLTNNPAVSPAKQIVRTSTNLDEISEKTQ